MNKSAHSKLIRCVCALGAGLAFLIVVRARSAAGVIVGVLLCVASVIALLLQVLLVPRRTRRPQKRQTRPRREEAPPQTVRSTGAQWRRIDFPLDVGDDEKTIQDAPAPVQRSEPTIAEPPVTEQPIVEAAADTTPETRAAWENRAADIPTYKITPPPHNPELFRRQDNKVVLWPGGRVVPVSELEIKDYSAEEIEAEKAKEEEAKAEEAKEEEKAAGAEPIDDEPEKTEAVEAVPDEIEAEETVPAEIAPDETETAEPEAEQTDEPEEAAATAEQEEIMEAPEEPAPNDPNVIYLPERLDMTREAAPVPERSVVKTGWRYPGYALLGQTTGPKMEDAAAELRENAQRLSDTLNSFGVEAVAGNAVRGPAVTRYEFTLERGVKLSKVTNLQDDIALALGASGVRIAPIPDKMSVVGIEVPNRVISPVSIRSLLESAEFRLHPSATAFAVGKDISGARIIGDIAKFPHVLIAGTTGSGKSVCTNSLIVSMLYKSTPDEVRFIMVDPKMVELAPYNGIPHLLIPVVTDPKKAAGALQWAVYEMMKRYKLFSEHNVKDLSAYNALVENEASLQRLPSIVVVIDELADLMLIAAKEVEESICRVAQMGRAAGMHLVIATQSPRADVITGLMKANIPSRIAFAVASSLESRIILDNVGAEKLVGKGDMLYAPLGEGKPRRVQGCFISAAEIERVVAFLKTNGEAEYDRDVIEQIEQTVAEKETKPEKDELSAEDMGDELLPDAVDVILETGQASVSMLQRRLKLGYSRAARLVDQMEELGVVGPYEGSKPRKILITRESWERRNEGSGKANATIVY